MVEKHLPHVNTVLVREYLRFAFPTIILCGFEKIMVLLPSFVYTCNFKGLINTVKHKMNLCPAVNLEFFVK